MSGISDYQSKIEFLISTKKSKPTMSDRIIMAAGVQFSLEGLREHLQEQCPNLSFANYEFQADSHSYGVMYSIYCKLGKWAGLGSTQAQLCEWYRQYKDRELKVYFTSMYKTEKVIVLTGTLEGKPFMIVASDMTSGQHSFFHKKNALSGQYGDEIAIGKFAIDNVIPYIHYFEQDPRNASLTLRQSRLLRRR